MPSFEDSKGSIDECMTAELVSTLLHHNLTKPEAASKTLEGERGYEAICRYTR